MLESRVLLSLHRRSNRWLDAFFLASVPLGTLRTCLLLVPLAVAVHARRGEKRAAKAWLGVGLATLGLFLSLKPMFGRGRPNLWHRLRQPTDFSFPSGHALSTAALYPLLAWLSFRLRGKRAVLLGAGVPLWVGFGRLYLGVHWPSDVLTGWALGAAQSTAAIAWVRRDPRGKPAGAVPRALNGSPAADC